MGDTRLSGNALLWNSSVEPKVVDAHDHIMLIYGGSGISIDIIPGPSRLSKHKYTEIKWDRIERQENLAREHQRTNACHPPIPTLLD